MASNNPVSPKIKWGAIWGAVLTVAATAVTGLVASFTPDMIPAAGPYGVLIVGIVTTAGTALAGYLTRDALREQGIVSANAAAIATVEASTAIDEVPVPAAQPAPVSVQAPAEAVAPDATPAATFGTDTSAPIA